MSDADNLAVQVPVNVLDLDGDGTTGQIQGNEAEIDSDSNEATGGDADGFGGAGGDAASGNTQADNGNVLALVP